MKTAIPRLARALYILGLVAVAGSAAANEPPIAPVVAELFTSQGCSSCPPAEALLGELTGRANVLPLAFHVTYWNDLGWQDRFSLAAADARQYRYSTVLGTHGAYTPQMVINGGREVVGSRRKEVEQALGAAMPPAGIHLSVAGGAMQATLPAVNGGCDCDLLLLAVLPAAQTVVGRGENAGRTLHEFNIVRQTYRLPQWDGRSAFRADPLPPLPADASLLVLLAQRHADARIIAVGVQRLAQRE